MPTNKSILRVRAGLGRRGFGIFMGEDVLDICLYWDRRRSFGLCRNRVENYGRKGEVLIYCPITEMVSKVVLEWVFILPEIKYQEQPL